MYVPRATYSLSTSFWAAPWILSFGTACFCPPTAYIATSPARGLPRRAEARVLADGPQAAAVHRRLDAAGVRVLAREADVAVVVRVGDVPRRVERVGLPGAGAGVP